MDLHTITITAPTEETVKEAVGPEKAPSLYSMDVNYSNQNKWFAHLALEDVLGDGYQNLNLHLTRFSIPQLAQTTTTVSYKGYQKEIPTKVLNADTKEVTLEYIVDSDWKNYKALYAWLSGIYGTLNPVLKNTNTGIMPSDYMPLRIYLLSPYKQKLIQFLFENCWIKIFNDVSLDVSSSELVTHSFTMAFDRYTVENI